MEGMDWVRSLSNHRRNALKIAVRAAAIILTVTVCTGLCRAEGNEPANSSLALSAGDLNLSAADLKDTPAEEAYRQDNFSAVKNPESLLEEGKTVSEPPKDPVNAHVYVHNNDDDSLDVSLFIDSNLTDTKSVSSDSEEEFGIYPLITGPHSFKITWWDEDAKKAFEEEKTLQVLNETSIILYTTENGEPEKYDLSIQLVNENSRDLMVYLYVDGSFEKSDDVDKESTSDLGEIELEEGAHELSVKWQDEETRVEYQKTKKITIDSDDVSVFYLPKGISFEAGEDAGLESSEEMSRYQEPQESSSTYQSTTYQSEAVTEDSKEEERSDQKETNQTSDSSSESSQSREAPSDSSQSQVASSDSFRTEESTGNVHAASMYSYPDSEDASFGSGGFSTENLYLYSAVVIVALYLLFLRR